MTDAAAEAPEKPAKSSKKPLIIGLVLAIVGAGGGYFMVSSGLLPFGKDASQPDSHGMQEGEEAVTVHGGTPAALPQIEFIELEPIVVSLNLSNEIQHLRFRAQLEVEAPYKHEVELILPRVIDVLNGYLRALEVKDLADPLALIRLRAQMLRRIQIVTGKGRIRDILIMDFVLN